MHVVGLLFTDTCGKTAPLKPKPRGLLYILCMAAIVERRTSTSRPAHEAEADDITAVIDYNVTFAAVNLSRLPGYGPEQSNLCSVVETQSKLQATVERLAANVDANSQQLASNGQSTTYVINPGLAKTIDTMDRKLDEIRDNIGKIQFGSTGKQINNQSSKSDDRSRNVVIAGVPESRTPDTWHNTVSRVLETVIGCPVQIDDVIRLGRYNEQRKRLILVKLKSAWDRRLVLSSAHKLRDADEFRQVYINADEEPEVRRQKTLERLKRRATRSGRVVSVSDDGIVSIDGTATYCVHRGYISARGRVNDNNER